VRVTGISRRLVVGAALVGLAVCQLTVQPASAAVSKAANNCIIHTDGTDDEGNLVITSTTCYDTYAEVLKSKGVKNVKADATPATTASATLLSVGIIGTHYDGFGATGDSVSVEGSDCSGGGLNLPTVWNDRISSTANGCPIIVHYQNANYGGATATTYGVGTLTNIGGTMNNQTTSIIYTS
jgi:hypothetical protein